MEALHKEITNYNNNIQLAAPPRWLAKKEAREGKLHSSVLLCFKSKQEADGVTGILATAVGIKNITENRGVLQKYLSTKEQQNLKLALSR